MAEIPVHKSSGNVFADIGFTPAEAAELTAKSRLITGHQRNHRAMQTTSWSRHGVAARTAPTLSKVLRGRMESVTIDRLTAC